MPILMSTRTGMGGGAEGQARHLQEKTGNYQIYKKITIVFKCGSICFNTEIHKSGVISGNILK
jgi:hypothetical protein